VEGGVNPWANRRDVPLDAQGKRGKGKREKGWQAEKMNSNEHFYPINGKWTSRREMLLAYCRLKLRMDRRMLHRGWYDII
jgi:hypothetical protein